MKKLLFLLILLCGYLAKPQTQNQVRPKLIVGIVVDQMRNDFIYRYWNRFGNGGFKRLINEGFYFKNAHYNYVPTTTGPGHCSIYTGTTPRTHGIIANEWYVKKTGKTQYCVEDTNAEGVGCSNKYGKISPRHQLSSTIGDEMKISSNGKCKVIGISLKDRSAVLPAGHAANAAYWMDAQSGNFVSSTWYMKALPSWVTEFNNNKWPEKLLKEGWNPLYPMGTYTNSFSDDGKYEEFHNAQNKNTLPYDYSREIEKKQWDAIKGTPAGNRIVMELACECLKNESMGKDEITDLLTLSFSSTDIAQHGFGLRAVETEDIYLRLDKDLETFFKRLDSEVGQNNYMVFLTADHGGADIPNLLTENKIPAGYFSQKKLHSQLKKYFNDNYGDSSLVLYVGNEQVFLDETKMMSMKIDRDAVEKKLCVFLTGIDGIAEAYPSLMLKLNCDGNSSLLALMRNGYNHFMSGNVAFAYKPGWMDTGPKGTTHGTGYNYDRHIPLIFFGKGIPKGSSFETVSITQIAPTVSEIIRVNRPNGTDAKPLNDFFK